MCGICGWFIERASVGADPATLIKMNAALSHRGPDEAGTAVFPKAALAMSRLSVIDLQTGRQPMCNEAETVWIVYNGEIYNFRELRTELEGKGYTFRSRSDTEVVLRAYEAWGANCVRHLRGMFAFAVYDRRPTGGGSPILFLARDRVGEKPLYYHRAPGRFVFASEIKALLAHRAVPRRLDYGALPFYLTYGYVPAPWTFFDEILELPPGHTLTVGDGRFDLQEYWTVPHAGPSFQTASELDLATELRRRLEEAVHIRLISDVPLGAFLSGGLDSTAIVALMAKHATNPVKTFSIGFEDEPSFNELEFSRLAAKSCGTHHHEFVVQADAIDLLPRLVWHHDQPFADSSAIPTFLVSRLTREHVTVALTGDGGDELFAGYDRFAAARIAQLYRRAPKVVQGSLRRALQLFPESTQYDGFVRRARRFVEHAPLPLVDQYLAWVSVFQHKLLTTLLTDRFRADVANHVRVAFEQVPDLDQIGQMLYVNAKTYLPGDLLVKSDRMTMANSLEARCPFLDHELMEFASRIPNHLKLRGLTTKHILKRAMEDLVPSSIVHRKKHGFGVPVGRWFRSRLRGYIRERLLNPHALKRGYFREQTLRGLLDEHQSGHRDHGHRLWSLLTLEVWHELFIDREPDFAAYSKETAAHSAPPVIIQ